MLLFSRDEIPPETPLSKNRFSLTGAIHLMIKSAMAPVHVLNQSNAQKIYFPQELIGGVCTLITGQEKEVVWRAAAAACGTERVHTVWTAFQDKIYYLATKSEEMASHHDTWCPFAALLPGMKSAAPMPVCYTYYSTGSAALMVVTSDGLEIYSGISLIARAKAERTARQLDNAPIIELNTERVATLTPRPWYSVSLFEDNARRILTTLSTVTALVVAGLACIVWVIVLSSFFTSRVTIASHQNDIEIHANQWREIMIGLKANPLHQQLADFARINDGLLAIDGVMTIYQLKKGLPYWRATVPAVTPADVIKSLDAVSLQHLEDGRIIIGAGMDGDSPVPLISARQHP